MNITSPSSSKFDSVQSLGTPQQAAERLRQQYLSEFMSTRLGSQKKVDIVSASSREADGRLYYDIEVRRALSAQCMQCSPGGCEHSVWL